MRNIRGILPDKSYKLIIREDIIKKLFLLTASSILIAPVVFNSQELNPATVFTDWHACIRAMGHFLVISLLLGIYYLDIDRHNKEITEQPNMLFLLCLILCVTVMIGKGLYILMEGQGDWVGFLHAQRNAVPSDSYPIGSYLLPLSLAPLLITLLFDMHLGIVMTLVMSSLAGLWLHDATFAVYTAAGGITACFGVMKCKRRACLLKAGFFISNVSSGCVLLIYLMEGRLVLSEILLSFSMAFMNGLLVATLASAILPLLENIFSLTTNISLLEWLDLNQPLMRQLLLEAPGTYHHSIITGNLVEVAAESIGENALLARVGAYYHDIGKIKMPEYFIENQRGIANRHDKLTPTMSSLILIAHVKEGVELARRNKLPMIITDIIRQHHGASLIKFFFDKAKELAGSEDTAAEENFRYPGPKPQNRVAALVMLADNVEAATRVLDDPTPARISNLVDNIIYKIYLDGQLDECDLTLKDLNKIKHQFVYILTGIHHKRIDYPGFKLITNESLHKKPTEAFKDRLQKGRNPGPKNSIFSRQK